tara:strand:- start:8002 stop:8544 length:543 start_codon:yes stop_codon:yes gene_type:complete
MKMTVKEARKKLTPAAFKLLHYFLEERAFVGRICDLGRLIGSKSKHTYEVVAELLELSLIIKRKIELDEDPRAIIITINDEISPDVTVNSGVLVAGKTVDEIRKALAGNLFKVFHFFLENRTCSQVAGDIAYFLNLSPAVVTSSICVLENNGYLRAEKRGDYFKYSLNVSKTSNVGAKAA